MQSEVRRSMKKHDSKYLSSVIFNYHGQFLLKFLWFFIHVPYLTWHHDLSTLNKKKTSVEVHFDEMILRRGRTRRSRDLQFPLWNNYVKLEGSNFKGTSCSRIIAWSVNDLSCLLRPEKKRGRERESKREGKR